MRTGSQPNSSAAVSNAARFAVEALEQRLHLSSYADRGTISVIVDELVAPHLTAELAAYKKTLIGDGYRVTMHDGIEHPAAPRMDDDENVWDNFAQGGPEAVTYTTTQYRADIQTVKDMIAADADANNDGIEDGLLKAIVFV